MMQEKVITTLFPSKTGEKIEPIKRSRETQAGDSNLVSYDAEMSQIARVVEDQRSSFAIRSRVGARSSGQLREKKRTGSERINIRIACLRDCIDGEYNSLQASHGPSQ